MNMFDQFCRAVDWSEVLRSAVAIAGALVVARLAVTWALSRYKAEKLWERRLAAFTDIVSALNEMRRINRSWFDDMASHRDRSEEYEADQRDRYGAARRRLEETTATGQILLGPSTLAALEALEKRLAARPRHDHWSDALDEDWVILHEAHKELVRLARDSLGIEAGLVGN